MEDEPDVKERAESGNYIHGLYYEGCGFDKKNTNMVEIERRVLREACRKASPKCLGIVSIKVNCREKNRLCHSA